MRNRRKSSSAFWTALLSVISLPTALAIRCIECPSTPDPPYSNDCADHCEGDVCYIVVNAFISGTISAGCINLNAEDKAAFSRQRRECHRESNRTVCACNTGEDCNSPKTPAADYDFVDEAILGGYDLGKSHADAPVTSTTEHAVVLSTGADERDEDDSGAPLSPFTSTPVEARPPPLILSLGASTSSSTSTTTTSATVAATSQKPTTKEEGLIEVKSSMIIKNIQGIPPAPSSSEEKKVTSRPHTMEISPVDLTGTFDPQAHIEKHGRVLPTDGPDERDEEDEDMIVVKTVGLQVKENEELEGRTEAPSATTSTVSTSSVETPKSASEEKKDEKKEEKKEEKPSAPIRKAVGEGSIEEAEVSTSVQLGAVSPSRPPSVQAGGVPSHATGSSRPMSSRSRLDSREAFNASPSSQIQSGFILISLVFMLV